MRIATMSIARIAGLAAMLLATGCGHMQVEPPAVPVQTITVKEQVPVPCKALVDLGPEPDYPDTDAAIKAAPNVAERARLYATGRAMRVERLAKYAAAKISCVF